MSLTWSQCNDHIFYTFFFQLSDSCLANLDILFTSLFIKFIPITFARPVWNLQDELILTNDWVMSNTCSFAIGNVGFILATLIVPLIQRTSAKFDSGPLIFKLLIEDCFSICNGVLHWFYWRGLWNLLIEGAPDLTFGGWSSTVLGLSTAILFGVLNSQTSLDCVPDGSLPGGKTIEFPNEYLRHILKLQ